MTTLEPRFCHHRWRYVFGMGRWYQCVDCRVIGDLYFQPGVPAYGRQIVPRTCAVIGCTQPATHLVWRMAGTVGCTAHQHDAGSPATETAGHQLVVATAAAADRDSTRPPEHHVEVVGEINAERSQVVQSALLRSPREQDQPVMLVIDSPGGDQAALRQLVGLIQALALPLRGLVRGKAHSAAFWLLQQCRQRLACRAATLSFHPPRIPGAAIAQLTCFGPCPDFSDERDPDYQGMLAALEKRSGQPRAQLEAWGREGRTFTAAEAKRYGFLDAIVDP